MIDATVKIQVIAGLTPLWVKAAVLVQPAEFTNGIPFNIEEYELLDAETEEALSPELDLLILKTEGLSGLMAKIKIALTEDRL